MSDDNENQNQDHDHDQSQSPLEEGLEQLFGGKPPEDDNDD